MPEISLVIPVYNEEECIPHLAERLSEFLATWDRPTEVILVDDGSTDRSRALLEGVVRGRPSWRLACLRRNRGQTAAMSAGLEIARGEVIVFMDADLQNDITDVPALVAKLDEGFDVVSGWRRQRQDKALTRRVPSIIANRLIGAVTGVRVHDYGCTLKAYRASVVRPLHLYSDMHRFLPALCSKSGARVTEIEVRHHPRTLGASKYGLNRVLKVLADLTVIKLIVTFADRPMHYFGLLSLAFLGLAGATAWVWATNLLRDWHESSIILPSVLFLFFCCFLYFLFIGLLAELVTTVFRHDPSKAARAAAEEI